jgi:hypothetical protein
MKKIVLLILLLFITKVFSQSPPTVTLNSPTKTQFSTGIGESMTISWTSTNQHHYGIYLWKGNEEIAVINSPWNSNAKSYTWTVPESVVHYDTKEVLVLNGTDYRIKIAIFNTQSESDPNHAAIGDYSAYITFVKGTNNTAPEHQTSSISPDSAITGSQFTFSSTWKDPENDNMTVEMRYKKITTSSWIYIGGNEVSYVPNTNPPRYKVTKTITGSVGSYKFESRAIDDKGLGANWEYGDNFQITEPQNNLPNTPSFEPLDTPYINQQFSVIINSGTDIDKDDTRIKLYATGTNYTQNNPYTSNYKSDGSQFTIPITFTQLGDQTITAFTEDINGAFSSSRTYNVVVQTQTSSNNSPNSASFISLPQEANINESINITVKKGSDPDNDATRIILYADDSNYSSSNPFDSGLSTSTSNITKQLTFNSEGTKTVYIKTIDENNAESSISTKTINLIEATNPINDVVIGNIKFTASNIIETSNNIFKLTGNVKANNLIEFTGEVILDKTDLSITGNGKVFLSNIPEIGEVDLYNGSFEYDIPNNSSELIAIGINEANEQFKMANLPIHINKIIILEDGINIEGKLEFPEFFNNFRGDITELQITKNHGVELIGAIAIDEIKLPNFDFKNLNFSFDTINDKFSGSGEIKTKLFGAGANVEIISSGVDKIGMFITLNKPYPLGTTGLSLSKLDGSITNIQSHPDPTMTITIGCDLVPTGVSTDVVEFSDVSLTYNFGTSLSGGGSFKVLGKVAANASFKVTDGLFKVNANINFYDVVNAAIEAGIAKNNNNGIDVFARFMASINIPNGDGFPFGWIDAIPGVNLPYKVAEFDNILYNNELTGKGEIGWFGVNFSYKLSYDGTLHKEFAKNFSLFNEITFPGGNASKTTTLKFQTPSNKYTNKKSQSYNRFEGRSLIISPSNYKSSRKSTNNNIVQDFVLTSDKIETIIVRIKPETTGSMPEFTLTTPNGEEVNQSNVSNYSNVEYTENLDDRAGYFTINKPANGSWDINLEDNGVTYLADIIGTKNQPGIAINTIEKTNNNLKIDWTDYNPDFNGQISLYYDYNNKGIDGNLITSGISEDDETDTYSFDISNLQAGDYYIYAIMYDNEGVPVTSYSKEFFTVSSNINAPSDFNYSVNSDNSITFNWTKIDNTNNYEYLLYQEENNTVSYSSQNINTGNSNSTILSDINFEAIHQFMIVAIDANGNLSEKSNVVKIDIAKQQAHTFNKGWNLVGFNIEPFNTSVKDVLNPIENDLLEIRNETQSYDPNLPDFLNTLKTIDNGKGYWVKLNEATQIATRGKTINLSTLEISLNQGWNLISFPKNESENILTALESVSSYILEVRDETQSYDPNLPNFLNTLFTLQPNKGYWIKVNQNCTLTFK